MNENTYSPGYWQEEIDNSKRELGYWHKRGKYIVDKYKNETLTKTVGYSASAKRFNILWSITKTLLPSLFSRMPKVEVNRRFRDEDPVARTASTILERCLAYDVEHNDPTSIIRQAVEDRLLPGLGVVWIRYEPKFISDRQLIPLTPCEIQYSENGQVTEDVSVPAPYKDNNGNYYFGEIIESNMGMFGLGEEYERIDFEDVPCDYVYWQDFFYEKSRVWEEVSWVARRVYMTHEELVCRFGEDVAAIVPLKSDKEDYKNRSKIKKAEVFEIWCKKTKKVYWLAEGMDSFLDVRKDILNLKDFFPCPRPLVANSTTTNFIPTPEYDEYQDQAEELNSVNNRIAKLVVALRNNGVYDASQKEISRIFDEGMENKLVPVDKWAMFAEKGGIRGSIDWVPIENIANVLRNLYEVRKELIQDIYELLGMPDIMRGQSDPNETARAQNLKSRYVSVRLSDMQNEVARFVRSLLRIKAEIICEKFQDETILQMSGIQATQDAVYIQPALQLLRNEFLRNFRIDVDTDTMNDLEQQNVKQSRVEFLSAVGSFLSQAVQAASISPVLGNATAQMLMFGVRGFSVGRELEASMEKMLADLQRQQQVAQKGQGQPLPSPEQIKAMLEYSKQNHAQQMEMMKMQRDKQKAELDVQVDNAQTSNMIAVEREQQRTAAIKDLRSIYG